MTQDEIIKMAREALKQEPREDWNSTAWVFADETLQAFAKLVAEKEREKIKHFLTSTGVSVQTRVYVGDEEISMLKMTHEEIRARGQE